MQQNHYKANILQNIIHEHLLVLNLKSYLQFVDNLWISYQSLLDYISLMLNIFNMKVLLLMLSKEALQHYELDRGGQYTTKKKIHFKSCYSGKIVGYLWLLLGIVY